MPANTTIKIRKGTESEWQSSNPILASGEPGYASDTNRFKIGNGISNWNSLSYAAVVPSGFLAGSGIKIDLGPNGSSATISISGNYVAATGTLDVLSFNTNIEPDLIQGQLGWNDTEGTVNIAITDDTNIHLGEHSFYRVRNTTGSPLYKGQAVYASGVHSNGIIEPALYSANGNIREIRFIGLMLENLNDNNNGYSLNFGHIENIDTRGNIPSNIAVGDETWADGDILYVHPTVAGKLTNVEPKHSISAAIILDAASNGRIFVRPTSYGHLDDNHDVNVSGVTDGQYLQYNAATDYWIATSSGNFSSLDVSDQIVFNPPGYSSTSLVASDASSSRTINLPDADGTVVLEDGAGMLIYNGNNVIDLASLVLKDSSDNSSVDWSNRSMSDQSTVLSIDWEYRILYDSSSNYSVDWTNRVLYDSSSSYSIDWANRVLYDSTGSTYSVDWTNRVLYDSVGNSVMDWSNSNIGFNNAPQTIGVSFDNGTDYTTLQADTSSTSRTINLPDADGTVSLEGHTHTTSDITDFNSSVSGLLPANLVTGTGIANHVAYWNSSSGIVADSGQLYWDSTNNRLGIGTASPSSSLQVAGTGRFTNIDINNSAIAGTSALTVNGSISTQNQSIIAGQFAMYGDGNTVLHKPNSSTFAMSVSNSGYKHSFGWNNLGTHVPWAIISSTGVGIGNNTPLYNLDVVGTGNFSQNLLVNGTGVSLTGHSHIVSDITDFATGVADEVNTTLSAGSGIFLDYDSGTDTLTIHTSGVRSKSLCYFTALNNHPPASNFATLDTRNSIAILDFDDTTEESAVFVGVVPENAVLSSGLSVRIQWMATSATSGNCRWGVQFEKMTTDLDSDSFDTATEAHSATNGTSGIPTITTLTCTSIDSLSAGDFFRIKIYRDVSDTTNDTMTGDAELIAIEIRGVV